MGDVKGYKKIGISEQTMREMAKFFMKTSIPRIVKEEMENERIRNDKNNTAI